MEGKRLQSFKEIFQGNLLILTIGDVLRQLSLFITFPYFSLYVVALGGSMVDIGVVVSLRPLLSFFLYPIAGYLSDQYDRVKVISITVFIGAILWGSLAFAPDWIWFAISNFLLGILTFYFPAANSLMADSLPTDKRGLGYSLWMAFPRFVGIFSPFIGGYLITIWGVKTTMKILYLFTFLMSTLIAIINYKFLKENERKTISETKGYRNVIIDSYKDMLNIVKWFPSNLRAYTVMLSLGFMFNNMVASYWIVYAIDRIGLNELTWGTILLISSIFNVILLIPGGILVDRLGITRVLTVSLFVSGISTILFPFCVRFTQTLAVIIVITIANSFLMSAAPAYMATSVPIEKRGRTMSAIGQGMLFVNIIGGGSGGPGMGALLTIPSIIGALIGGFIYNFNPLILWFLFGIAMLVSSFLALFYLNQ